MKFRQLSHPSLFSTGPAALLAIVAISLVGCDINFSSVDGYNMTKVGETAETEDEGTIESSATSVEVVNKFGVVTVRSAEDGETPGWKWKGKVWASTQQQADEFVQQLVIESKQDGDKQQLTLLMPESNENLTGVESSLEIIVGSDQSIDLSNRHGDTSISKINQNVTAETGFGELLIQQIEGKVEVRSQHGKVAVKDVQGNVDLTTSFDDLILKDISGEAKLRNAHGNIEGIVEGAVDAETSFGDVKIECRGSKVEVNNAHGDIELKLVNKEFAEVEVKSSFGDIELTIPADSKPKIDMKTTFGDAESQFESSEEGSQSVTLKNSHGDIKVIGQ